MILTPKLRPNMVFPPTFPPIFPPRSMSDTEIPDLVSDESDESDNSDEHQLATTNNESAKMWMNMLLKQKKISGVSQDFVIRLYTLGPFLFGQVDQPDKWIRWAFDGGLLERNSETKVECLKEEQHQNVDIVEKAVNKIIEEVHTTVKIKDHKFLHEILDLVDVCNKHDKLEKALVSLSTLAPTVQKMRGQIHGNNKKVSTALLFAARQYADHVQQLTKKGDNKVDGYLESVRSDQKKSEEGKRKGNEAFVASDYRKAITMYQKAVHVDPFNHILYGNRAQAYLNIHEHWDTVTDGRRAAVLKPDWPKGQYRYAQAYLELNMISKAFEINSTALQSCAGCKKSDLSELEEQRDKIASFTSSKPLMKGTETKDKAAINSDDSDVPDLVSSEPSTDDDVSDADAESDEPKQTKSNSTPPALEDDDLDIKKQVYDPFKVLAIPQKKVLTLKEREAKREVERAEKFCSQQKAIYEKQQAKKGLKRAERELAKTKKLIAEKARKDEEEKIRREMTEMRQKRKEDKKRKQEHKRKEEESKAKINQSAENERIQNQSIKDFIDNMAQGTDAMLSQRSRNSLLYYTRALNDITTHSMPYLKIENVDVVILKYATATAGVSTGIYKEILVAIDLYSSIPKDYSEERFPLCYLGTGKAYHRLNRFSEALEPLAVGQKIVDSGVNLGGVQTWPASKEIIPETKQGVLKKEIEKLTALCKNPPRPDAVCRLENCTGYSKRDIYFSDPDFKGFFRIKCCEHCKLEYHMNCFRKLKQKMVILNDKDFITQSCFTPNCIGPFVSVRMFDADGIIKKEIHGEPVGKEEKPQSVIKKQRTQNEQKLLKRQQRKEIRKQKKLEDKMEKVNSDIIDELESIEKKSDERMSCSTTRSGDTNSITTTSSRATTPVFNLMPDDLDHMPPELGSVTVLKKEEDDNEWNKVLKKEKKKKKKEKAKNVALPLQEFVSQNMTEEERERASLYQSRNQECIDDDTNSFEDGSSNYAPLDPNNPFSVPENMRRQIEAYEELTNPSGPASSTLTTSKEDVNGEIAETLYLLFEGFLMEHGPLQLNDITIQREISDFPPEASALIQKCGGLKNFILRSNKFAVQGAYMCLLKDVRLAKKLDDELKQSFPELGSASKMTDTKSSRKNSRDDRNGATFNPRSIPSQRKETLDDFEVKYRNEDIPNVVERNNIASSLEASSISSVAEALEDDAAADPGTISKPVIRDPSKPVITIPTYIAYDSKGKLHIKTMKFGIVEHMPKMEDIEPAPPPAVRKKVNMIDSLSSFGNIGGAAIKVPDDKVKGTEKDQGAEKELKINDSKAKVDANSQLNNTKNDKNTSNSGNSVENKPVTSNGTNVGKQTKVSPDRQTDSTKKAKNKKSTGNGKKGDEKIVAKSSAKDDKSLENIKNDKKLADVGKSETKDKVESKKNGKEKAKVSSENIGHKSDSVKDDKVMSPFSEEFDEKLENDLTKDNQDDIREQFKRMVQEKASYNEPVGNKTENDDDLSSVIHSGISIDENATDNDIVKENENSDTTNKDGVVDFNRNNNHKNGDSPGSNSSEEATVAGNSNQGIVPNISSPSRLYSWSDKPLETQPSTQSSSATLFAHVPEVRAAQFVGPVSRQQMDPFKTTVWSGADDLSLSSQVTATTSASMTINRDPYFGDASTMANTSVNAAPPLTQNSGGSIVSGIQQIITQHQNLPSYWSNPMTTASSFETGFNQANQLGAPGQRKKSKIVQQPKKPAMSEVEVQTEPYEPYKLELEAALMDIGKYQMDMRNIQMRFQEVMDRYTQLQHASNTQAKELQENIQEISEQYQAASKAYEIEKQRHHEFKRRAEEELTLLKNQIKPLQLIQQEQLEQLQDKERKISELHNHMSAERDQTIAERISLNAAIENMQYQMEAEKNRAKQSEISLLQLKLEHGSQSLDKSLNEAEACANKLFQIIQTCREKNQPILSNIESSYAQWKDIVDKTRDIKLQTKLLFDEQIEKIEQGRELSTLPDLPIPRTLPRPENAFNPFNVFPNPMMAGGMGPPRPGMVPFRHMPHGMVRPQMVPSMSVPLNIMPPPSTVQSTQAPSSEALPAVKMPPVTSTSSDILPPQMTSMAGTIQRPIGPIAPIQRPRGTIRAPSIALGSLPIRPPSLHPGTMGPTTGQVPITTKNNSFEKIMMMLHEMFPRYTRVDITNFIQELRKARKGSLTGMSLEEIVQKVSELILKTQQEINKQEMNKQQTQQKPLPPGFGTMPSHHSLPTLQNLVDGGKKTPELFQDEEDPCVICHEEMKESARSLECGHHFHDKCIRKWLKENSTCPTCRDHTLLPDEYPTLV